MRSTLTLLAVVLSCCNYSVSSYLYPSLWSLARKHKTSLQASSSSTTTTNNMALWFQHQVTVTAPSRGCHLITGDILKAAGDDLKNIKMGMCNLFIQHTRYVVLGLLTLERKIIVMSTRPSLVLDVCELIRSLLFPFDMCAPYVPRLTEPFKSSLEFPGALFVGIRSMETTFLGLASVLI
jgi:hypothetical protein